MIVLFIHGMGRSPLSAWPLLLQLRHAGLKTQTFGYSAAFESFDSIVSRLRQRLLTLDKSEPYLVVGHSLGGVLFRAAMGCANSAQPIEPAQHVYLLGSPQTSSRLARSLRGNLLYRAMTGDCGQLLGLPGRMEQVGPLAIPTTCIAGTQGIPGALPPFHAQPNDGVVSVCETLAPWASKNMTVPVAHTFLPASKKVGQIILEDLQLR